MSAGLKLMMKKRVLRAATYGGLMATMVGCGSSDEVSDQAAGGQAAAGAGGAGGVAGSTATGGAGAQAGSGGVGGAGGGSAEVGPTGVGLLASTDFESASLGPWVGVGSNAYKVLSDPNGWDEFPESHPNIDTLCDEEPIADYHEIDLEDVGGTMALRWAILEDDYPNRVRMKVIPSSANPYDEYFLKMKVRFDAGYVAGSIGEDRWHSFHTLFEDSDSPIVVQLYSLTGQSDMYLRLSFERTSDNTGVTMIDSDQVQAVVGDKVVSGEFTYVTNESAHTVEGDRWYTLSFHYLRGAGDGGSVRLWLDDTLIAHATGDTAGTQARLQSIDWVKLYPGAGSLDCIQWVDDLELYETVLESSAEGG